MSRQKTAPSDARSRILAAATDALIAGDGALEMADLARRASVSTGLAYHYFGSKAGLVAAVVADFYDRYDAVVNQAFERGLSWNDREAERLRKTVAFLFSDPLAPVVLGRLAVSPEVADMERRRRDAIIALAAKNIARGQAKGEIDPHLHPDLAAAVINGGLRQAAAMALADPKSWSAEAFFEPAWRLVQGALGLRTKCDEPGRNPDRTAP